MNYTRMRNPVRLLQRVQMPDADFLPGALSAFLAHNQLSGRGDDGSPCGQSGPVLRDRHAEVRFLQRLAHLSASNLRPLVVVMGGFMDWLHGNGYGIRQILSAAMLEACDLFYREHPEAPAVRELVDLYHRRGLPVMLIGHSWGADAVVHGVALACTVPVRLLITLDPVSRKPVPQNPLPNVAHWRNVYVDYQQAAVCNLPNMVARIGRPWQVTPAAHENIRVEADVCHADAVSMFQRHAGALVAATLTEVGGLTQ